MLIFLCLYIIRGRWALERIYREGGRIPIIRKAQIKDADIIHEIAVNNSIKNLKETSQGFLVSNYELETYQEYIQNNKYFWVIEDDEICAFLLAFTRDEINPGILVNQKILEYCNQDFVIIKQICVSKHHKGYATQLYKALMGKTNNIFAAVVLEPVNQTSIDFHQKLGFNLAFNITPEDNLKRAIYKWSHSNTRY